MNTEEFDKVNALDRDGLHQEAFDLLTSLGEKNDPIALFELSARYFSSDGQWPEILKIDRDLEKSKILAERGRIELEKLANDNDGEAMRMLGYLFIGHLCPYPKNTDKAENLLLQSVSAGCHFAANDLATYYQGSDIEKAKYWYKYAEDKGCRVVHNPTLET